jgi:hypothetical protein
MRLRGRWLRRGEVPIHRGRKGPDCANCPIAEFVGGRLRLGVRVHCDDDKGAPFGIHEAGIVEATMLL